MNNKILNIWFLYIVVKKKQFQKTCNALCTQIRKFVWIIVNVVKHANKKMLILKMK